MCIRDSLSYNLSQASCLVFVNMMGTYAVTTRMYTAMFANCIYMLAVAMGCLLYTSRCV